jgi:hypothetical protein
LELKRDKTLQRKVVSGHISICGGFKSHPLHH